MGKRLMNGAFLDEDWYLDLPDNYKLLYTYIKFKCDPCGIWRVNRRHFSQISTFPRFLDDFINAVNKDEDGEEGKTQRIILLDKKRLWLPGFIAEEYGKTFNPKIGAHRGMIRLLVDNGILLKEVPDFSFGNLYKFDSEQLTNIVHARSNGTLHIPQTNPTHALMEREREMEQERLLNNNNGVGENPKEDDGFRAPVEEEYGNPPPTTVFDWEYQKLSVMQDEQWIFRMINNHQFPSRDAFDKTLVEFFDYLADSNDKKMAQPMCRHFNHWYPKREYYFEKLEAEKKQKNAKSNTSLEGKQNYKNMSRW